ncbi:MAG: hypothetical protein BWY11_00279 [Firmicutes bacterium ADurb.Bin182]|nr:MAG: hypothetical protein BWY11_00279 [Firmicutes bacterium ADurb.Bin182]
MFTKESITAIDKSDIQEASKALTKADIIQLVEWLSLKDDTIRYQALLLLQCRSMFFDDVYPFWDTFRDKLKSGNSYQRSIGLALVAENAKWDVQNRMEDTIDEYLALLKDEKPITIRRCVQELVKVVPFKPGLNKKIIDRLISFDFAAVNETMRKSILLDILNVLLIIRKEQKTDEAESFIMNALSGEILDKKSKKQIAALLS